MTPDLTGSQEEPISFELPKKKKKMQCHCCDRGIHSSGQETSLLADRLIHCLPVCAGDKVAPVPSQGLQWVQSWLCRAYVASLILEKAGLSLKNVVEAMNSSRLI